jgi:glycosyltransferase involved in cell wall biosynthesis
MLMQEMNHPKITIVTPSYNQGKYIEAAIQSVLAQGYPYVEHIILDNCSTDQTLDVLKKYDDHIIWRSAPDKGQSDALNQGFRMASGDIIGWLNADDLYLPGCFSQILECFARRVDADIVYGDYRWINETGEVCQNRREIDFDLFILKYLHVLYIPTTATFFRRKVFDQNNFLDPSFRYAMDYEFFLRLAQHRYRFVHISYYLADFRWHSDNKSTVGLEKQLAEQEAALLQHDDLLCRIPTIARTSVRLALKWMARGKRYLLKSRKGYYINQWQ